MQSLRYGLGDYECHSHAAIFVLKCLYSSNHRRRRQAPFFIRAGSWCAELAHSPCVLNCWYFCVPCERTWQFSSENWEQNSVPRHLLFLVACVPSTCRVLRVFFTKHSHRECLWCPSVHCWANSYTHCESSCHGGFTDHCSLHTERTFLETSDWQHVKFLNRFGHASLEFSSTEFEFTTHWGPLTLHLLASKLLLLTFIRALKMNPKALRSNKIRWGPPLKTPDTIISSCFGEETLTQTWFPALGKCWNQAHLCTLHTGTRVTEQNGRVKQMHGIFHCRLFFISTWAQQVQEGPRKKTRPSFPLKIKSRLGVRLVHVDMRVHQNEVRSMGPQHQKVEISSVSSEHTRITRVNKLFIAGAEMTKDCSWDSGQGHQLVRFNNRQVSMQHVRRPVWRPVWRPGLFTHEPVTSRTGQTITATRQNVGTGFGTLSVYVVEFCKKYTTMVRFFSVNVKCRVFGVFWQNFEWIQGVLTCVSRFEKKRCEMAHVMHG